MILLKYVPLFEDFPRGHLFVRSYQDGCYVAPWWAAIFLRPSHVMWQFSMRTFCRRSRWERMLLEARSEGFSEGLKSAAFTQNTLARAIVERELGPR